MFKQGGYTPTGVDEKKIYDKFTSRSETFESLLWEQINKAHNNIPKTQIIDAIENVVKTELEIDLKTYLCDPMMRARLEIEETKGSSSL